MRVAANVGSGRAELITLVNPCHLDGFEDFFIATIGCTSKLGQLKHPVAQIGKSQVHIISLRMMLFERDCNVTDVVPVHRCSLVFVVT